MKRLAISLFRGGNRIKLPWQKVADISGLLFASVLIAFTLKPYLSLTSGTPTGGDMASHFTSLHYLRHELLPAGRLMGWHYGNYCGFPLFQFYFPLPFLAMSLAGLIAPLEVSFKLICILSIIILPLCVYIMARLLGARFPAPVMAAVFTLPFVFNDSHTMWGGNVLSLLSGEFNYQYSFGLSLVLAASLYNGINRKSDSVILNSILLAVVGLCHGVGLVFVSVCSLFFLIDSRHFVSRVVYLAKVYLLGICLMGFWLFPFLAGSRWSTKYNLLWNISGISEVFPCIFLPFLAAGLMAFVAHLILPSMRRGNPGFKMYVVFGALGSVLLYEIGYELNVVDIRFLPYLQLLGLVLSALVLGNVVARLKYQNCFVFLIIIATGFWVLPYLEKPSVWAEWNFSGFEEKRKYPEFVRINSYLQGNASDSRVAYENSTSYRKFGTARAFESLPFFSGRATLEGLYMQSSISTPFVFYLQSELSQRPSAPLPQYDYTSPDIDRGMDHLQLLNAGHFIAKSNAIKEMIAAKTSLMPVYSSEDVTIYKTPHPNRYVEALKFKPVIMPVSGWRNISYNWFRSYNTNSCHIIFTKNHIARKLESKYGFQTITSLSGLEHIPYDSAVPCPESVLKHDRITISGATPGHPLLVKVSFHPGWKVDNAEGPFLVSPSFMMIIPDKPDVEMYYGRLYPEITGFIVSLLALCICLVPGSRIRKRLNRYNTLSISIPAKNRIRWTHRIIWVVGIAVLAIYVVYQRTHSPIRLVKKARSQYSRGDETEALESYNRILVAAPDSGVADDAAYFKGIILWKRGDFPEAAETFRILTHEYGNSSFAQEAAYHHGLCLREMKEYAAAEAVWRNLIKGHPESPWSTYARQRLKEMQPQ